MVKDSSNTEKIFRLCQPHEEKKRKRRSSRFRTRSKIFMGAGQRGCQREPALVIRENHGLCGIRGLGPFQVGREGTYLLFAGSIPQPPHPDREATTNVLVAQLVRALVSYSYDSTFKLGHPKVVSSSLTQDIEISFLSLRNSIIFGDFGRVPRGPICTA